MRLARSIGPGAVLYCDLDGFKAINDAYGHAAGDQVLQTVAERLRRLVRGTDTVYRIGGDEFVVVADGMPVNVCARLAEQIAASLSEPIELDHTSVSVRCSVGTAVLRPGSGDGASALEAADRAMYAVKSGDTHAVRNR